MEQAYEDVVKSLITRGHEVALLTTPGCRRPVACEYVQTFTAPAATPGRYSQRWWRAVSKRQTPWLAWNPDVVFSVSRAAGNMSRAFSGPIIAQCHGTAIAEVSSSLRTRTLRELAKVPLNLARSLRERAFYADVDRVIAIGDSVAHQLMRRPIRLHPPAVVTIPNGVDSPPTSLSSAHQDAILDSLGIARGASIGISSSRLHPQKGVDLAIRALASLAKDTDAHLIVCGDGAERSKLVHLAKFLGVSERIHFMGRVSRSQLADLMALSDTLVLSTRRREGLPLSLLEGIGAGLSVITTANAMVPGDVLPSVHVVEGTPAAIAGAWRKGRPPAFQPLPVRYRKESLPLEYERVMMDAVRNAQEPAEPLEPSRLHDGPRP